MMALISRSLRAACRAGLAGGAKPGGLRFQRDIFLTQLHGAHDLIRLPVKKLAYRAAACALDALVAKVDVLSEFLLDSQGQIRFDVIG